MSNKTVKNMRPGTANPRNPGPSRTGSTQKMSANIKVVVRVRPQNSKESELNYRTVVDVVDDKMLVFDPKEEHRPFFYQGVKQNNTNFLKRPNKELKFVFDHVFEQECSNMDVFESSTKNMIEFVMKGYNCSVFAYGATGAGKTFTMIGSIAQPGITYLTMEHLFREINSYQSEREFDIGVSYIEVYNENVYDLLKPSNTPLQLREDSKYGVMVAGLTLHNINTARELLNMLENGNKNRTQHPTDANAESSRSHAVFQVYIKMRYKTSGESRLVKLSMIDLAGSERASATGCVGERFKEGANINRSLLSLGNCINKLADGSAYIPYRDSKLTRLLKDSLGGNCRTVMIANVSPSSLTYEDTYNTLKYAARANKIQLSIKKNLVDSNVRISQYGKIIDELKNKVKELEAKLLVSSVKVKEEQGSEVKEMRRRILESERCAGAAQTQLLSLQARRRMLALGNRLRRAHHARIALLTSSSADAYHQMFTDEESREVRSVDSYTKQMVQLNNLVDEAWEHWRTARERLQKLLDTARTNAPALQDLLEAVTLRLDNRTHSASTDLDLKLFTRLYQEQNLVTCYIEDLSKMLKKLFLTLKGYDKVPPALAEEYLNLTKKAKCLQSITWSDQDQECDIGDPFLKFLSTLNLEKPTSVNGIPELDYMNKEIEMRIENECLSDSTCDFVIQNCNGLDTERSQKRKCPKPTTTDETIVIEDSFENIYESTPAKKAKSESEVVNDQNTFNPIEPSDLNSTFVMAGKVEAVKDKPIGIRRELMDRTNLTGSVQRINSNRTDGGRIVKPVQVARVAAFKKPQPPPKAGFGSSLSRDGTPLHNSAQQKSALRNNIQRSVAFKLARPKERNNQLHSYARLANGARR